ncbi:heavy-metal-associated domain-containing protein [Plebeiibacterium marinum]|uniref:Heavy-metal-associated domain-containing protein n=1 Tax=Plebeiibacterium marinum TaxID=2992111 RepID=A0AAE3SKK4_9BACT|nr:heavy metal-associated domain-containing protein [Plebeiobacterium marinum]MCW3806603.1 heavy-metal-associated domain-containing protein [Plebeiobacterium marinum]
MKNLKLVIATLILTIGFTTSFAQKKKAEVKEVTYICSIDCHSCKNKIMKNIPYEKGVKSVVVDIPTKEVKVTYKSDKNNIENIEKAIEKLGFTAEVKKEKQE